MSWAAYWVVLAAIELGPLVGAVWRATRGSGSNNAVSASMSNTVLSVTVAHAGQTTWSGSISLTVLALWIAVPPLLVWIFWAASRPRIETERAAQ
jgi:hypothetical protein